MTVKDMVKQWLTDNGYDGLCSEGCSCGKDDLMPCWGCWAYCVPASIPVCSVCGKKLDHVCQPADAICGSCVDNALSDEMDGDAVDEKKI